MAVMTEQNPNRSRPIEDLGLPVSLAKTLRGQHIPTIGTLTLYTAAELRDEMGLGTAQVNKISQMMHPMGLCLREEQADEAGPRTAAPEQEAGPEPDVSSRAYSVERQFEVEGIESVRHGRSKRAKRRKRTERGMPMAPGFGGVASAANFGTLQNAVGKSLPPGDDHILELMVTWKGRAEYARKYAGEAFEENRRLTSAVVLMNAELLERGNQLDSAQARITELQAQLEAVRSWPQMLPAPRPEPAQADGEDSDDGLLLERAEAERDAAIRGKAATVAYYREQLRRLGSAETEVPLRDLLDATSIRGVLDQARAVCSMVRITADLDAAEVLDHHSTAGAVRSRVADTLATLQAYAEAKAAALASGSAVGPGLANVRSFCADPGAGALISANHVSLFEGSAVTGRAKLREFRMLPVPPEVAGGPRVFMCAHVRIGSGKPPAPRLHFFDDTDASGLVVVGWVGEHLPNLATN